MPEVPTNGAIEPSRQEQKQPERRFEFFCDCIRDNLSGSLKLPLRKAVNFVQNTVATTLELEEPLQQTQQSRHSNW